MSWQPQTFAQMRSDAGRTWFRRSDIIAAIDAEGLPLTWYEARQILAEMPRPEKRYGHYRYTAEHRDAILAEARIRYSAVPAAEPPHRAVGEPCGEWLGNRRSGDGAKFSLPETPPDAPRHGANTRTEINQAQEAM